MSDLTLTQRAALVNELMLIIKELGWSAGIPIDDTKGEAIVITGRHNEVVKIINALQASGLNEPWYIYHDELPEVSINNEDENLN